MVEFHQSLHCSTCDRAASSVDQVRRSLVRKIALSKLCDIHWRFVTGLMHLAVLSFVGKLSSTLRDAEDRDLGKLVDSEPQPVICDFSHWSCSRRSVWDSGVFALVIVEHLIIELLSILQSVLHFREALLAWISR